MSSTTNNTTSTSTTTTAAAANLSSSSQDVHVEASRFDPALISEETRAFNQSLMDIMAKGPKWYQVGAEKYRQMRARGETPLPAATLLDSAETFTIPSRDAGRSIPARILKPSRNSLADSSSGDATAPRGVFMHIHGGGWVLQNEASQDPMLQRVADSTGLLAISIGYRLAPEHAYPAAPNDCYDAADWLVLNSQATFGAPLMFVGGESAGGHLASLVAVHLLEQIQSFALKGLLLHYGCYDLTFTPSVYNFQPAQVLVLDHDLMEHYREVFLPGMSLARMRDPKVSPLYTDFERFRGRLPPALFTCGTQDPLLDDTVFMSAKWIAAGADTVVKIFPGVAHGYTMFPEDAKGSFSKEGHEVVKDFVNSRIE